jgi:hypothetical protein
MVQIQSKIWNRSSALSPEELGTINTAIAQVMERADVVVSALSLSERETVEFYEGLQKRINEEIAEFLKERQKRN